MPEIFRVPLTAGFLALHADPDSETGLSLEAHNGEEGVMVAVTVAELHELMTQFADHAHAIGISALDRLFQVSAP
jgi:hypothetical protein